MESWDQIVEHAELHDHYVQFYKADEPLLNRNVGRYLWEGLLRGDALVVIATQQRQESLTAHLLRMGADVTAAVSEWQIILLDAQGTLDLFMVNGRPQPRLFDQAISSIVRMAKPRGAGPRVRAYGEMVGILWEAGELEAAILVEEYWNNMIWSLGMTLFCGYPIDVFGNEMASSHLQSVIRAHTHLVPAGSDDHMNEAIQRAMEDVLGPRAETLRLAIDVPSGASIPAAEAAITWLRSHLPQEADEILSLARDRYQATTCAA